jgi:putative membrane protein
VGGGESPHQQASSVAWQELESMQTAPSNSPTSTRVPIAGIVLLSAAAVSLLLWLIYVHHAPPKYAQSLMFLPALNALLNSLSAIALIIGFAFIRRKQIARHRVSMMTAFAFSALFLVSYVANHALHGDMLFAGHGAVRDTYLAILISHIFLSVVVLPLVLITFFFSLSGRFAQHKRIARYTFPIWLYVSVTGVIVYAMLAAWR